MPAPSATDPSSRSPLLARARRSVLVQVVVVLAGFSAGGAASGWLWFRLWSPPEGVVSDRTWYTDEQGLRADFSGTGLYVLVAVGAGLLLGALAAYLCERSELATLAAVAVGSAVAGWLMWMVGVADSPPDPATLARAAQDGTRLPGHLHLAGDSAFLAFPAGALVGLLLVYVLVPHRRHRRPWSRRT